MINVKLRNTQLLPMSKQILKSPNLDAAPKNSLRVTRVVRGDVSLLTVLFIFIYSHLPNKRACSFTVFSDFPLPARLFSPLLV